jgi:hypothetical protein
MFGLVRPGVQLAWRGSLYSAIGRGEELYLSSTCRVATLWANQADEWMYYMYPSVLLRLSEHDAYIRASASRSFHLTLLAHQIPITSPTQHISSPSKLAALILIDLLVVRILQAV